MRHWWHQVGRPQRLALLVGVLVTLARFCLIGKGTMAFVDESRYVNAMLGLRALSEGHGQEFLRYINSMGARPGDGIWRAIPGLGQALLLLVFDLNPNAPPSLQVPQAFNVLIVSLNALLLYHIYRRFFSVGLALLGLALYSSLVNTNLYLRHLLPYDHSLFFFFLALTVLLRPKTTANLKLQAVVGILAGLSYAIYPGYFMGPILLLAVALLAELDTARSSLSAALKPAAVQLVGLLVVLLGFEGLARLGHTSYWASSRYIATTVTQGSFAEGFSFIGSYFWQVEGWLGISLLLLFGVGVGLSWRAGLTASSGTQRILVRLLTVGFLTWLGYALAVQVGHKLVFYGRTLHFFVPIIIIGALVTLRALGRAKGGRAWHYLGIGGVVLAHFGIFLAGYLPIDYPCDVAYRAGIYDYPQIAASQVSVCNKHLMAYRLFGPRLRSQLAQKHPTPTFQLLNFAYLYPVSCYQPAHLRPGKVVADVPYFMKYPAYQFEGHSARERAILQNHEVDFQIVANGN
ncbi:hypothetical protein [Hymenobacter negativus]|uniref:Glycosyltransferase RgtA/B/C/D-like domain-containing protein n=1 Tax=Hymenobacter negativus TaxID=2795026 RepID=A0ABS0Q4P0_9BACT|nr:hypothetical protein [Hymenobacter negativus]MBH8557623.1 hypothetical protein [Hymenobacter negativus]